jgi:hypothetical protein
MTTDRQGYPKWAAFKGVVTIDHRRQVRNMLDKVSDFNLEVIGTGIDR